ncbi:MAG: RHS repeat-associated core domain-containing protein [Sulfuricaulis sp.]
MSRIADTTGNTIEFSYNQNAATGEMDIAQIRYTGKIALTDVLNPAPTFTRTPYANVTFNYATLPIASQRVDYVAGMKLALTQQLGSITVNAPVNSGTTPNALQVARTYHLNYGTPTASGLQALASLQECAPNGSGETCYPPTQFTWNFMRNAVGYTNGASTTASYDKGLSYLVDYKIGDIDGDGRQDLVWIKDQSCDNTGSGATRFQIFVSLGRANGFAAPVATGVYVSRPGSPTLPSCGADWRSYHFDTLWFLYDFSGDGRDDLLVANGTAWNGTNWTDMTWKIYPAIASTSFTGAYTFDSAHPVATGIAAIPAVDGMLADENGDGLPDLVHANTYGGITSHLLQKQTSGTLTFNFAAAETPLVFTTPDIGTSTTSVEIQFNTGPGRNIMSADINGDGASDFIFKVQQDTCGGPLAPVGQGGTTAQGFTYHFVPASAPASSTCKEKWYTFRNDGIQSDGLHLDYETDIGGTSTIPSDGSFISLIDINGDGQADLVFPQIDASGNYVYYYRLNIGKANDKTPDSTTAAPTNATRFAAAQPVGLTLSQTDAERVQFLDVNGDHRADIVYQAYNSTTNNYPLNALIWGATSPTGFGAPVDVGNSAINSQNPSSAMSVFLSIDGSGGPDLVTYVGGSSSGTLSVYGYGPTFGGNDYITTIANGLGALTSLNYYPLAYTSSYTRAYDGPAQNWGRGSPVFDVFSAIWVVHSAVSSAPTAGNAAAESSVIYRYGGAKVQAGGRGFLGFATVQAENQQAAQDTGKYLVTTTHYLQNFPFIGRPDHTVVQLESSLQLDPCVSTPGDSCFVHNPPPCGSGGTRCNAPVQIAALGVSGQLLSDAADQYTSNPVFAPGSVQPLLPYLSSSDEQKFDVTTSGVLSHEVTSSFTDDIYGNQTSSSVLSSESGGTDETKTTSNIYGCTIAPPTKNCSTLNTEWQRLGRLSISTVTSSRPGQTNNVRRASFEYDPTTLLRIADIQGPYDSTDEPDINVLKTLGLRTDLIRDADGNVIEQVQCSTYHFANRSACTNLSGFQQRQWASDTTKIQRYAKWNYESLGRFELYKLAPFYSSSAGNNTDEDIAEYVGIAISGNSPLPATFVPQAALPVVVNRDVFGNPANKVSGDGDQWSLVFGTLGRAYFAEDVTTGGFSRTTYTWCKDATSPGIPTGAPRANCPSGAVYRVTVDSTASSTYAGQSVAPTTWTYFDTLGREMLRTKRIYQPDPVGNPSKLHWSSVATTYDSTGRVATTSTPYFSIDPATSQTTLASSRAGTVQTGAIAPGTASTTYDAVDRARTQSHPEEPTNGSSSSEWNYSALTTTATNPRLFQTQQTKNARDEVTQIVAPVGQSNALTVTYGRDAVGNITSIQRTPADGSSAGKLISTGMIYDRLGRKTNLADPDKGGWTYSYNALGELVSQVDAKGQTQSLYRDALGRLYQRTENRASGSGFVSEPTSTWVFDTALRSNGTTILGVLHVESNGIGGYTRTTEYNDYGRVDHTITQMDSYSYTERQTYDQFGRPFQHFDPSTTSGSSAGELTIYSTDGYPIATQEAADSVNGIYYDKVVGLSERGQVTDEIFHNNAALETVRTFDHNTGRVLNIDSGNSALQNWSYDYDKHSNLMYRWNHASGYNLREDFLYDDLDRLHTVTLSINGVAQTPVTTTYDQLGNPLSRTGGQAWTYGTQEAGCAQPAGPHAASRFAGATFCYDANGNQTTASYGGGLTRAIVYTGYDLPAQISTNGYPSNATESFAYAPDRSMFKRVEGISGTNTDYIFCNGFDTTTNTCPNTASSAATTYYVGNVEARISGSTTTTKRYIGSYLVITTVTTGSTTGNPAYAYLYRDALGSIDAITNELAQVLQRQSFDAWGNRRDASASGGWGLFPAANAASFDTSYTFQGYTGHQQLDPVGLVHMKGRLYDPALGRFIQADPMTESDPTQGLNRYSYVLNNPMSLTDPSGYLSFRQILGIAIAVVAAYFGQYELAHDALAWSFGVSVAGGFLSAYVATGSLKAGLWGAFAAGVFWGIGTAFTDVAGGPMQDGTAMTLRYQTGSFAAKVAAHAAGGGIVSSLEGGSFGSGFLAAGATEVLSPAIDSIGEAPVRIMASSVVGGTVSKLSGGKFANGAETALFQQLFNQTVHATMTRAPTKEEQDRYAQAVALSAQANAGLSCFRFGSEDAAADWFSQIANPITAATGYEVGANIIKDDFGYYLYNLHVSPFLGGGAVNIAPPGFDAEGTYVAYDHTHPNESGFSDNGTYWNKHAGYQGNWGDLNNAISQGVDAYVSLPSGSQFKFDYGAYIQAQTSGQWTVYARDFVVPIK